MNTAVGMNDAGDDTNFNEGEEVEQRGVGDGEGWTETKSKRKPVASPSVSVGTPSPQNFKNVVVDEIARKQGKKDRKRAKRGSGNPPSRS